MDAIIDGQQDAGIEAKKFLITSRGIDNPESESFDYVPVRQPGRKLKGFPFYIPHLIKFLYRYIRAVLWADVIHWQYSFRFWPEHSKMRKLDFAILSLFRKPAIAQFHGLDFMRNYDWAQENPWWLEAFSPELFEEFEKLGQVTQRDFAAANFVLAMGHGMLPAVLPENEEKSFLLERTMDVASLEPSVDDSLSKDKIVIMHGPSSPQKKGTKYVLAAIEEISKARDIDFVLLQDMSRSEVIEELGKADIVVEQLLCGDYGLASVEAMARGCAVVANVCPSLQESYPSDLPIVSATPDTVKDTILDLIDNPERRIDLAYRGHEYAMRVHSIERTRIEILKAYRKAAVNRGRKQVIKRIDALLANLQAAA